MRNDDDEDETTDPIIFFQRAMDLFLGPTTEIRLFEKKEGVNTDQIRYLEPFVSHFEDHRLMVQATNKKVKWENKRVMLMTLLLMMMLLVVDVCSRMERVPGLIVRFLLSSAAETPKSLKEKEKEKEKRRGEEEAEDDGLIQRKRKILVHCLSSLLFLNLDLILPSLLLRDLLLSCFLFLFPFHL